MGDSSGISVREGDVKKPQIASCGSIVFLRKENPTRFLFMLQERRL